MSVRKRVRRSRRAFSAAVKVASSSGVYGPEGDEAHCGRVDMHANDMVGVDAAQLRADKRAPITALRAVALIAQALHQLSPRRGDARRGPSGLVRRPREPEARDRGDHQVKGVAGVAAMRDADR